jgi:hypothetical protein
MGQVSVIVISWNARESLRNCLASIREDAPFHCSGGVPFDLKETRHSAQDAALYVPCNDELAFAKATAVLMDNAAQRDRMGRFGRGRVEKELQWTW